MISNWFKALSASLVVAIAPVATFAQDYPSKPIQLVVGFPAGGPTDIVGRVIADQLGKHLNQSVVVINKGGAGGTVGAAYVAQQKPDGYTLMLDVESVKTRAPAIYKKLQYDPIKDFAPIAKMAKQRVMVVVHPSLPVNNVRELIAHAKANPDKLNYSGTYSASSHVGGALFALLNGVNMTMVNYPGGAQPITDLIGGVVQVGFFTESTVAQHVKAGKLKALAIAANERSTQFPQLPTMKEAGAAAMDISPWFALTAPAGTPQPVIDRLHAAAKKITEDPAFAEKLATIGAVPILGSTPDAYTKESIADIAYWKKFVVDAKFPLAE
jgi:tripartite-type tricarboxylate transporter receptor subunit TctC